MNKLKSAFAVVMTLALLAACKQETAGLSRATDAPDTDLQKQSYALGSNMSNSLKQASVEIDQAYFNAGFYDTIDGQQLMTVEDMQAALMAMRDAAQAQQVRRDVSARAAKVAYIDE